MKKINDFSDLENRIQNTTIDQDGMLCLGTNKIHPDSNFGRALREERQNIRDLVNQYEYGRTAQRA